MNVRPALFTEQRILIIKMNWIERKIIKSPWWVRYVVLGVMATALAVYLLWLVYQVLMEK